MSIDTSTTDTTAGEPDPAVTDDTATVDTAAAETPEAGEDGSGVDEDQDDDAGDGPGREAAKYRRRLRDAEAQRDQLAERVESLQRAEVERLATDDKLRPAALWASGIELDALLGDDGTVDPGKVTEAIEAARQQLGIPTPPSGNYVRGEGRVPGRPAKPSGRDAMAGVVMGRVGSGD